MGICWSQTPTLEDPKQSISAGYIGLNVTANPYRASIYGVPGMDFERDMSARMTECEGSTESKAKLCESFGYKCIKGLKHDSPNQDDFCVIQGTTFSLFGVFDGHGNSGHKVAHYVQRMLPQCLLMQPDLMLAPKEAILKAFSQVQGAIIEANASGELDASESGSTATIVLQLQNSLFIAHLGDSRAAVFTEAGNNLEANFITSDHKPSRQDELKRINRHGGEVKSESKHAPFRFFQRGTTRPGLSISRSLGDLKYHSFGLSYVPEITEVEVTQATRYVVAASDGVWEYLTPTLVAKILGRTADVNVAAEKLVSKAWDCWMYIDKSIADDITAVVSKIAFSYNE